ncbi:MAG: hypothetical protein Q8K63_06635 [Acidimicrobiales bacterium]|nr:hypothetical protein [Acidimicrobiales bacterium]
MFNVRLQVLIDEGRSRALDAEAARRGVSVATLVREGIDKVLPEGPTPEERKAALARILAAPKIDVPQDPDELRRFIDQMYDDVMPEFS